ncbi:MAG: GYD domain-containing protein [Thermoleophilia bacterium]|nr:GYD domain-containing protein [Thermoleophilia bacterium]
MAGAVILMKLTDQGIRNIKQAPQRIEAGVKAMEAMGGKVTAFYATMGPYDYVAVGEGLGDEALLGFLLALGAQGNVTTTTLKGFSPEEFAEIVKSIP